MTINFIKAAPEPEPARQSLTPRLTPNLPPPSPRAPIAIPPDIRPISSDSAPTITDWSSAAHAAAADTLERERQGSPTSPFTHTPREPDPPGKPGIFGSEQLNHRAGQVDGGTRFWVNDNCYFDVPTGSPPPRMAGEFHLLTRVCNPPPTGGGDKMFEDLKPDAMKKLPSR
jgi:hypothetical protein